MRYSEAKIEIWKSDEYMIVADAMSDCYNGPKDIAVDLGAHVGTRSIWLATDGGFSRVYAVEMELENYVLLVRNIQKNGLRNIIIPIHAAVSDRPEIVEIKSGKCNRGQFSIAYDTLGFDTRERVLTVTLRELFNNILIYEGAQVIDFVKMDLEGAEYKIFSNKHLAPFIFNCVRFLFLERHGPNEEYFTKDYFKRLGYDAENPQKQLFQTLNHCGFTINENKIGQLMMYNKNLEEALSHAV